MRYRIAGRTEEAVGRSFPLIRGTHLQLESCFALPMKHTGWLWCLIF